MLEFTFFYFNREFKRSDELFYAEKRCPVWDRSQVLWGELEWRVERFMAGLVVLSSVSIAPIQATALLSFISFSLLLTKGNVCPPFSKRL
jgi:hypothetical protein